MVYLLRHLRSDALVFLSVPVGRDTIVLDSHRVYGAQRLPLLFGCFTRLATFGPRTLAAPAHAAKRPIFVLRPSGAGDFEALSDATLGSGSQSSGDIPDFS